MSDLPAMASADDDAHNATLAALADILDDLSTRSDEIPDWEVLEGALTALLCMRRAIAPDEWLPALLEPETGAVFADAAQRARFVVLWQERAAQIRAALEAPVEDLDDERTLMPAVVDWRGLAAAVREAAPDTPPDDDEENLPAFAQLWAIGFLTVVAAWEEDWYPPRDRDIAHQMDVALGALEILAEDDDDDAPLLDLDDSDAPRGVSGERLDLVGEALWAVYDLYAIARALGPRQPPRRSTKVGRNDPCPCGSGKKYKHCCGA